MTQDHVNLGGHDYGQSYCLFSKDSSKCLIYVNIPKNASSWAKRHMPGWSYNFVSGKFDPVPDLPQDRLPRLDRETTVVEYLVILRDPLDRWVTGLAQYLRGWDPKHPLYIDNLNWDHVIDKMVFDSHTDPQVNFIKGIDYNVTHWLRCDRDLWKNFADIVQTFVQHPVSVTLPDQDPENTFNVTSKVEPTINPTYITARQQYIVDRINQQLQQRPDYVQRIRNFYQADQALYNSVAFHTV